LNILILAATESGSGNHKVSQFAFPNGLNRIDNNHIPNLALPPRFNVSTPIALITTIHNCETYLAGTIDD
jgi:hypothetical protein